MYASYFKAGGNWCVVATIAMLCVLAQTLASASDFFISEWVNMEEKYVIIIGVFFFFLFVFYNFDESSRINISI